MAQGSEIWQCPECSAHLDVSDLGFCAEVVCTQCGHKDYVHTLLANFRLEGVLGVGGMSIVLRGSDVVLGRPVAIKLLNELYRDLPERIARFENECAMMAKVHHENVVSVYSAGWAKNQFYIAMELLEGRNLESIVAEKGPLDPLQAVEITYRVVKGLEAAHIAGLLHRDMKPGNIIMCEDGVPKVLDFGLAQGKTGDEDTEEVIWATPYYVSPETLQRNAEDARTDIYSLGMTLRFLLTGIDTLPGNPSSVSALLDAKYRLPSLVSDLPKADECLCDLVDHMTAFAPEERHDNYADLLAELREVQAALHANLIQSKSPAKRWARRAKRVGLAAALLAIGAFSYGIAYYIAQPSSPRDAVLVPEYGDLQASGAEASSAPLMLAMRKGQWKQAVKHAVAFDKPQVEPTMASWCLLHGACVAYLSGQGGESVNSLLNGFKSAMAKPHHHPAASEMKAQLSAALNALENDDSIRDISDRRVLGMVHCLRVRRFLANNKVSEARKAIASAKEEFRLCQTVPYSESLLELTDNLEACYAPAFALATYNDAAVCLAQHRFADALSRLNEQAAQSPAKVEEIKVLQEVCECGATLRSTLERLMQGDYVAGMDAATFSQLNREKNYVSSIREREFCALLLLLKRDYRTAFAVNPYASQTDSNEPFAVLMRDWEKRLAPYMKE